MLSILQFWRAITGYQLLGNPAIQRAGVSASPPLLVQDLLCPPPMRVLRVDDVLDVRVVFLCSVSLGSLLPSIH